MLAISGFIGHSFLLIMWVLRTIPLQAVADPKKDRSIVERQLFCERRHEENRRRPE
jgi:hypothetical protein